MSLIMNQDATEVRQKRIPRKEVDQNENKTKQYPEFKVKQNQNSVKLTAQSALFNVIETVVYFIKIKNPNKSSITDEKQHTDEPSQTRETECETIESLSHLRHDKDMNVYMMEDETSSKQSEDGEDRLHGDLCPIRPLKLDKTETSQLSADKQAEDNEVEQNRELKIDVVLEVKSYAATVKRLTLKESFEEVTEKRFKTESETGPPKSLCHEESANETLEETKQFLVMKDMENKGVLATKDGMKNNCKKKAEEGAQDFSRDKNETDLMTNLFDMKYFCVKPPIYDVYWVASEGPRTHPKNIGDIPWTWLREEKWRLHTFATYPHKTAKSAIVLASEGFAYCGSGKGNDDKTICFFCCVMVHEWRPSDVIPDVHKQLSSNCPMVTGVNCNNVPMMTPQGGAGLFSRLVSEQKEKSTKGGRGRAGADIQTDSAQASQQVSEARPISEQHTSLQKPMQMAASALGSQIASNQPGTSTVSSYQASDNNATSTTVASGHVFEGHSSPSPGLSQPPAAAQQVSTGNSQAIGTTTLVTPGSAQPSAAPSNPPRPQANRGNAGPMASQSSSTSTSSSTPTVPNTSTSQTSTTQTGSTSQGSSQGSQGTRSGRGPTYGDLGIITERPKRYEYAVRARRLDTFEHWPRDHHLKKEDLSAAGFYYAGYGDCARCFYCGGGLRNWEDDDNVWVEHARWFPKCAFIRQQMGQAFVDTVQDLNKDHDQISYQMVTDKMGASAKSFQLDSNNLPLKRDPAVKTVIDMGFAEKDVLEAANYVKEQNTVLSADKLFEKLEQDGKQRNRKQSMADSRALGSTTDPKKEKEVMEALKDQNNQLRQQTVCKICMDKEVAVVFLPCGHLVSCTDCAAAMKDCPVCRNHVKGIVRAFMS